MLGVAAGVGDGEDHVKAGGASGVGGVAAAVENGVDGRRGADNLGRSEAGGRRGGEVGPEVRVDGVEVDEEGGRVGGDVVGIAHESGEIGCLAGACWCRCDDKECNEEEEEAIMEARATISSEGCHVPFTVLC